MKSWYAVETRNHQGLIIDEETGANIAVAYDKAHAPLIAAAPELLSVTEKVLALLASSDRALTPYEVNLLSDARAAIQKARGE